MKILVICEGVIPVPPMGYGGIERVADILCRGFSGQGFQVSLLGHPDSKTSGMLYGHKSPSLGFFSRVWRKVLFQPLSLIASRNVDVVLNFGRIDYLFALRFLAKRKPFVFIFQNPISGDEDDLVRSLGFSRYRMVSISNQQRSHVVNGEWVTIYNAVNTDSLRYSEDSKGYLAYLGRINENKGADIAIDVARRSGLPLKIGGNIPNESGANLYFERKIAPFLGDQIKWVGEINDHEKADFLGGALALLMPLRWDEPFGIVMAEALACGTPVIAFDRGSVREVITHGKTGFIVNDLDGMISSVRIVDKLSRLGCRQECLRRFSEVVMIRQYLDIVDELRE